MSSTAHHIGPDSAPDRYRLLRSIGRGGEAVLYLAEIELAGGTEPVVVKVLDSKTTITPEVFERISQKWNEQAELLRFVHRPGVVGVREHFQGPPIHRPGESGTITGRALVLVMNHVDGLDLRDWRAERTLTTPGERREVMRTLEQLADVLDWLHSGKATPSGRTVVHGDLSPGNVMVDEHGQATLVDFGLSKLTADHQTAEVWFTPGYAAPEIFEGKRTPGTDRYAFGAIAYFILSGQSPPTAPEQLGGVLGALPQVAGLPAEQRDRVLSIASADPGRRPLSLSAWVKDVRHGVVSTTTSRPATIADAVPATPHRRPSTPPLPATPPPPAAAPVAAPTPAPLPEPPVATPPPTAPSSVTSRPGVPETSATTPHRRRKPRNAVVAAVVAVVLLATGAVIGARYLGDGDSGGRAAGSTPGGGTTTATPSATTPSGTPGGGTASGQAPTSTTPSAGTSATGNTPGPGPSSVSLTTLDKVARGDYAWLTVGDGTLKATYYETALVPDGGDAECSGAAEYNLGTHWKTLTLLAGIDDASANTASRLIVSVDGKAVYTGMVNLGKPEKLTLDLDHGLRLRIEYEDPGDGCDMGRLILAEPKLST
ncbi:protein kinase [Streptomyces sp. TX20-6-3]|uniref:protein kinase domain-containing protein n=1 Tax=Streptomyces sp. TX20-6-3 TaxID=3028705 RepID=UPI0029B12CCC|nr:protein kinase [Streptomyces sp. TX20-6-3]MDX2565147.1 protein kinase [Streptomyces sp. TX20-6-3]